MAMQAEGKSRDMETRTMTIIRHICVAIVVLVLTATGTNAQLINGGFELGAGIYTNYCSYPTLLFSTGAVAWVQFNCTQRISTNDALLGAINPTTFSNTAHSGMYSLKDYGPNNANWDASGAYQVISNGVAPGQTWILSGWALNWSGDPMSNKTVISSQGWGFGEIQIAWQTSSGGTLTSVDGQHLYAFNSATNPTPEDTWISCVITATAPAGAGRNAAYAMRVGRSGFDGGSIFWDDLSITNLSTTIVTNHLYETITKGNQVCWTTDTNSSYQAQSSADNVNWANLGTQIQGNGATNCVFDTVITNRFYRVLQLQ
jgi:hypothetical protein